MVWHLVNLSYGRLTGRLIQVAVGTFAITSYFSRLLHAAQVPLVDMHLDSRKLKKERKSD